MKILPEALRLIASEGDFWTSGHRKIARMAADEIERLRQERDVLLGCRKGQQRCHECPDIECCDNTNNTKNNVC